MLNVIYLFIFYCFLFSFFIHSFIHSFIHLLLFYFIYYLTSYLLESPRLLYIRKLNLMSPSNKPVFAVEEINNVTVIILLRWREKSSRKLHRDLWRLIFRFS